MHAETTYDKVVTKQAPQIPHFGIAKNEKQTVINNPTIDFIFNIFSSLIPEK